MQTEAGVKAKGGGKTSKRTRKEGEGNPPPRILTFPPEDEPALEVEEDMADSVAESVAGDVGDDEQSKAFRVAPPLARGTRSPSLQCLPHSPPPLPGAQQ